MSSRFLRPIALVCTLGLLAAAESQPVHYWNGEQRVELELALDELDVHDQHGARRQVVDGHTLAQTEADADAARAAGATAVRGVVYHRGGKNRAAHRGVLTGYIALRTNAGQDAAALAAKLGFVIVEPVPYSPDTVIVAVTGSGLTRTLDVANHLYEQERVIFATPMIERQRARRVDPNDAQFVNQWHLKNTGFLGAGNAGNDINVTSLWNFTAGTGLGTGVNIAVVDDGLETTHADLSGNARTDIDIDLNSNDQDPNPGGGNSDDIHGTSVGGVAAARGNNSIGTSGVAPRASLVGIRLIAGPATDSMEGQAMTHTASETVNANRIHISNNSWGPPDDGASLEGPGPLMQAALVSGTSTGRGGLGIIYCWAGGNGGNNDVANYDGYANSRYVIAVGASRHDGTRAGYSELGTNLLVNAPGGDGSNGGMVATDRTGGPGFAAGSQDFTTVTDQLIGTSFATPVVAGVVALMLEANPNLTWRDVRHALVRSATKNHAGDGGWITNGVGLEHNLKYGFGRVNAAAAVALVAPSTWVRVPAEATPLTASESVSVAVPDNNLTGISRPLNINAPAGFRIEHVDLTVSATHTFRGDLRFRLTSPAGTVSDFQSRANDGGANFSNWTFGSVVPFGEDPNGSWTLQVSDEASIDTGNLTAWSLRIHGYVPHSATPTLASITPTRIGQSSAATEITLSGTQFVAGASRARRNGVDLVTTVDSTTQARAVVSAGNLTTPGAATITIATPGFDGQPAQVSGGQTLTVDATPVLSSITPSPTTTTEDTAVVLTVNTSDSDSLATALVFTATSSNQAVVANGNLVFSGSGFSRSLTVTPVPDVSSGSAVITVRVSDVYSSASSTVTVTITGATNDPPVAVTARFRTTAGVALSGILSGYDPDGDTPLGFAKVTDPDEGTLTVNTNGSFTYQPTTPGFRGMDVFTFEVTANGQTSVAGQAFVTVAGDPNGTRPLIVSEPVDEQIATGGTFTYQVVADTRRYVVAPTLEYTLVGEPAGMTISETTGLMTWVTAGSDRHVTFGIVVKDSVTGALDTQTVVLRVVGTSATN